MAGLTIATDDLNKLKRQFELIDINKDGILSKDEIKNMLKDCDDLDVD